MDKIFGAFYEIRQMTDFAPQVAIVLGSGLGGFADCIEDKRYIEYSKIKGMPTSTVEGHIGRFVCGTINGVKVIAMQGRVHLYEGYSSADVVLPIRLMGLMGAKALVVTNAAGGITFPTAGTLMLINDQISSFVPSPLIGKNDERLGIRFKDMTESYDKEFIEIAKQCAKKRKIDLKEGVYMQFSGPQFESPAEIRMARTLGADAVGMSTTIEVIAARHMDMRVLGISCITNAACGIGTEKLSHVDVQKVADIAGESLQMLICDCIAEIKDKI